jgi:carbohydrate diacid regulator
MSPLEYDVPSAEIINDVAKIIAPHTINVISETGTIFTSSDPKNIGKFHAGGFEAANQQKTIEIRKDEEVKYAGCKASISTPIIKNGKFLGVIEIDGEPDEIRGFSSLISLTTNLFLDRSSKEKRNLKRKEIRDALTELIVGNDIATRNEFVDLSKLLNIEYLAPISVILVNAKKDNMDYETVFKKFVDEKIVVPENDLLLKMNDGYLLIKSKANNNDEFLQSILDKEEALNLDIIKIAAGFNLDKDYVLYQSYLVTQAFKNCAFDRKIYNAMNPDDLVLVNYSNNGFDLSRKYCNNLIDMIDSQTSNWIYPTMEAYLHEDGRIQGIADYLSIHKNTCIYRVNKILKLCNFENCRTFTIAHFFGIILQIKRSN